MSYIKSILLFVNFFETFYENLKCLLTYYKRYLIKISPLEILLRRLLSNGLKKLKGKIANIGK